MQPSSLQPWLVSALDYPVQGTPAQKLEFLLQYAILAPSSHNCQPWLFHLRGEEVDLYADRSRRLKVTDPHDRQLLMGCGAALLNLRVAMRRFGYRDNFRLLPDTSNARLIATIGLGERVEPSNRILGLFEAIPHRRTNRQPFELRPVSQTIFDELERDAAAEGAWLVRLHPDEKDQMAALISKADKEQFHDRAFRKELAEWVVSKGEPRADGMPCELKGFVGAKSYAAPLLVRTFDMGNSVAAQDIGLAKGSPLLVVLGTDKDSPLEWIRAGQAMERVLLAARIRGIYASFLNQPIELDHMRRDVGAIAGRTGWAQLVLRMGFGPEALPTPRRSIREVLVAEPPRR